MRETYEISDRFIEAGDANHLLYEPLSSGLTFRRTRRYELEFEGTRPPMEAFVRKTLFDEISQEFHEGEEPALKGFTFFLDYGMKPGALDLEKETILRYYAGIKDGVKISINLVGKDHETDPTIQAVFTSIALK